MVRFPKVARGLPSSFTRTAAGITTTRICVNICTPIDGIRRVPMPNDWFSRVFSDEDGVAAFFQQMSGGRQLITFNVFSIPLLTKAQKANADTTGSVGGAIAAYRAAATLPTSGIPVSQFDHFVWAVDDDGISTGGSTIGDSLVGAIDFCQQTVSHETTHYFGCNYHADLAHTDDYGDLFCLMGGGGGRGFANPRLAFSNGGYSNSLSGPGICAPYLYAVGWLDYARNVTRIAKPESGSGTRTFTLVANQGAPAPTSTARTALAIGDTPLSANDPAQYWIEYRHPSGFDRDINQLFNHPPPDFPATGVVLLHEMKLLEAPRGRGRHTLLKAAVPAVKGQILPSQIMASPFPGGHPTLVAPFGSTIKIVDVDPVGKSVVIEFDGIA